MGKLFKRTTVTEEWVQPKMIDDEALAAADEESDEDDLDEELDEETDEEETEEETEEAPRKRAAKASRK